MNNSGASVTNQLENAGGFLSSVDQIFQSSANMLILWILAAATIFQILDLVGLFPAWASNWVNRNRLRETMRLLKEFGVDVDTPKRTNRVARLENVPGADLASRVKSRLKSAKIGHDVIVGSRVSVPGDHYFDLMGATADLKVAQVYARDLSAHWRYLTDVGGPIAHGEIDFVVTPKTGSPLLGASFAELVNKPLLLHNPAAKFRSDPMDPRALFDFVQKPAAGSRGLIVDDSSTGGGKAEQLIDDLKSCGWEVSDFLVVFEPQLKVSTRDNAAARLQPKGVALHSIVKT